MRRWWHTIGFAAGLLPAAANAYTAAGDRTFSANLLLPQIAPSDAFWGTVASQATTSGQQTQVNGTYGKTITERLGIQLEDGLSRIRGTTGGQNFDALLQYEAVLAPEHEFVLSFQIDHEFGGTGNTHAGAARQGATQPGMTFGKGLGDLPIDVLRPLAITGFAGYQVGEGTRPNVVNAGFSLQYSMPYLVSKVADPGLPAFVAGLTATVELWLTTPASRGTGGSRRLTVAPGVSYGAGEGWELGIEALIPTSRAPGTGLGVIAQVVVQLDYLLPDSLLGRPLFAPR